MNFDLFMLLFHKHFPNIKVKYKNESIIMQIIGMFLFFTPFMSKYSTTIGNTIYFPNKEVVENNPYLYIQVIFHELVHVQDNKKYGSFLFNFLYATPQIFALLSLPLFFFNWIIGLIVLCIFLAPLPSYYRMKFESKAYLVSLYVIHSMRDKYKNKNAVDDAAEYFLNLFKNKSYYFMWPNDNIDIVFDDALVKIKNDMRPYEDPIFDTIDDILNKIK